MTTLEQILWGLAAIILTAALAYWAGQSRDDKVKVSDELAELTKDMEQLKVTAVSEQRVREIIKDAIQSTSTDVKEIKAKFDQLMNTLHKIEISLASEIAFKKGVGHYKQDNS